MTKFSKMNRKMKIGLIVFVSMLLLLAVLTVCLMFMAKQSASDYRGNASKQLNDVIAGKSVGAATGLSEVWFGESLSDDYKKANSSQDEYKKLLVSTKNYVFVLNIHNELVSQYNTGLEGDGLLDSKTLKTVNQYADAIRNRFPLEDKRLSAMEDLSKKIVSTGEFDAVSTDIGDALADNDDWLNDMRENLNKSIIDFQKKIN